MEFRSVRSRVGLSIVLIVLVVSGSLATPQHVRAVPPEIGSLRTDGNTVVWRYSHYQSEIHLAEVGAKSSHILASGFRVGDVDVSGQRVIWVEDFGLTGIDLETGEPLSLPDTGGLPAIDARPSISGDRLVWMNREDSNGPWRLLTVDVSADDPPSVIATISAGEEWPHRPVVTGDRVVWGVSSSAGVDWSWELWTARIGEEPVRLASGTTELNLSGYDVAGNTVVYAANEVVYVLDVRNTGATRVLSEQGRDPTTDGRYVFWADWQWRAPVAEQRLGYDLATNSYVGPERRVDTIHRAFWARGGIVAMSTQTELAGLSVEAAPVLDLLPSARHPDPGRTDPSWLYFVETGHYLSHGFKEFWGRGGDLPVFGFPLTTEYDEFNVDLGKFRTVQYTERQRFEYHPELARTPYETLLGRLGAADALDRGLTDHPAFQPLPADTESDSYSDFFPQTGHRISHGFRDYWRSHGLDFGDSGVSYRESLALFGYPISEEFVDPATGLVTQHFERAVFEYHPDNPDPYKVLLRRLGAEGIDNRDW
jgi:hypothetical protein